MVEQGETPLEAAQRELAEEVGLRASSWTLLGTGYSSATTTASGRRRAASSSVAEASGVR